MALFLARRWRRQPPGVVEVDRRHPLGAKVQWAYAPWLGLTTVLAGSNTKVRATPQAGVKFSAGSFGQGLETTPNGDFQSFGVLFNDTAGFGQGGSAILLTSATANRGTGNFIEAPGNGSGLALFETSGKRYLRIMAAATARVQSAIPFDLGTAHCIGFSYRAYAWPMSSVGQIVVDGVTVADQDPANYNMGAVGKIGTGGGASGRVTAKHALFVRLDLLTIAEHAALAQNPWQLFKPRAARRIYSLPAAPPSTPIELAGAALAATSATGTLSTAIRLAGSAASATFAAGTLTVQVRLAGAAIAGALADAGLTTAIRLAGGARGGAAAAGELTTGVGIELAGHAKAGALATGTVTTTVSLAGDAVARALAAGDLSSAITLTATAPGSVSATGALSTAPSGLAVDASALVVAQGGLTTGIALAGAAAAVSRATGALNVTAGFAADAFAAVAATGVLSVQIRLDGAALAGALAAATLTAGGAAPPAPARTLAVARQQRTIAAAGQTRTIAVAGQTRMIAA